ncbi:putative bifunctional diguanylate cyclase/phosphodiesterase [Catenuloplanes atrovinosus]|uniref:Signal transduction protein with EAL and GGDEF domain n=1 Tax=Catenuloplanes atrovinosus TaxID=137266 RepID=A0AAE3YSV5_9ACTN|nr:bifunctional diguanylate cyclase/phosphodiesterase [Catenuloplanes atrovinosus]MDR7279274.1 putative signal transduction protein with EAL and GGDEF domain [Catenuloplanes atrovinosus]
MSTTSDRRTTAGYSTMGGPVRALYATVLAVALTAVLIGLLIPVSGTVPSRLPAPMSWAVVAGLVACGQLARVRVQVTTGSVSVTWGEAALIVGLHLLPAPWLPAATAAGAVLAWTVLSAGRVHRATAEAVHAGASLVAGTAVAAVLALAIGPPPGVPLTFAGALALTAAATAYLVVSVGLAVLTLRMRHGLPVAVLTWPALRAKLPLFVGNVLVGLAAVAVIDVDPRWLLFVLPTLWFVHHAYGQRLRNEENRRTWITFASATGALAGTDQRSVATAGAEGALDLFGAERVEVDVITPTGVNRYTADHGGLVVAAPPANEQSSDPGDVLLARTLVAAERRLGEIRVHFPAATGAAFANEAVLTAYGDALALALGNAAITTQVHDLTEQALYQAAHDPLTELTNRVALLAEGDRALSELDRGAPAALLLFDVDRLKRVNEAMGHAAGDALLRALADRLLSLARPGELLARLDGDEFALLLTAADGPKAYRTVPPPRPMIAVAPESPREAPPSPPEPPLLRRARLIAERLAEPIEVCDVPMSVEVTVGVAVSPAGAADMAERVRQAEHAMYRAKSAGVRITAYDSAADAATVDHLSLLAEMRQALAADDQLVLDMQPAVDLATGAPTGVEALIRWEHPRRGLLTPADFVRAVEESELLARFTGYVLDQALATAGEWRTQGLDVPISVNLSARNLLDPRLPGEVGALLRRHHVPPHLLVLEITETVAMSRTDVVDEVIDDLRELGVQLSLDDFGTGFSSLSFITRIPVDELKVDRSFVRDMADSTRATAVIRATVELGRRINARVVAEGVETADQRAALVSLGCDAGQGYHFCRPVRRDKIIMLLRTLRDSATRATVVPLRAADDAS